MLVLSLGAAVLRADVWVLTYNEETDIMSINDNTLFGQLTLPEPEPTIDAATIKLNRALTRVLGRLLTKCLDNGGISVWVALDTEGTETECIGLAAGALPIPNNQIRTSTVQALTDAGWMLEQSPAEGATEPHRHFDASLISSRSPTLGDIETFITAFNTPILNPWRLTNRN